MRLLEFFRPFRLVVSRRVSEEEQVSVEAFCKTEGQAIERLASILGVYRDHRKKSNEEVVRATQQQLAGLEVAITARGETLHDLDEKIAKKHSELAQLNNILAGKVKKATDRGHLAPVVNGLDKE